MRFFNSNNAVKASLAGIASLVVYSLLKDSIKEYIENVRLEKNYRTEKNNCDIAEDNHKSVSNQSKALFYLNPEAPNYPTESANIKERYNASKEAFEKARSKLDSITNKMN